MEHIGKSQKKSQLCTLKIKIKFIPLRLHVIFALLLSCCILVLLVLGDQIVHVALCLCELHLVHTFTCVPMQECFSTKHCREVLCDAFEHLLNRCGVSCESNCHLQTLGWNVANRCFDIVGNPFHKVRGVLIL